MKIKAFFNWSSGKDSALALYHVMQQGDLEISALFTSMNQENRRVSMHGVSMELLTRQAESIGLPLITLELPPDVSMAQYESLMLEKMNQLKGMGIQTAIFGDIFLEDLRKHRMEQLSKVRMDAVFPLWKRPTKELIAEFIGLGFRTVVTCVRIRLNSAMILSSRMTVFPS
jgi:uncharacterized protein (TIGR00290 family)